MTKEKSNTWQVTVAFKEKVAGTKYDNRLYNEEEVKQQVLEFLDLGFWDVSILDIQLTGTSE